MRLDDFSLKRLALVSSIGFFSAINAPITLAQTIDNPGFENSLNDWVQTEPASSSGVERTGSGSAKLSGSGARISQTISVSTNTNYTLTAYISGSGTLGVTVGGSTSDDDISDTGSNSTFEQAQVSFNSGSNSSVTIFGAYNGDEGRFDDFSIASNGSSGGSSSGSVGTTYNMRKQNTDFSIDGAGGAQNGIQIYLWNTSFSNVNQQWEEIDVGSGFVSYRKKNTGLCIDGGNGGQRRQAVILFTCNTSNQNQHWSKINTAGGSTRLQKRNASGFSIDGKGGAERRQTLHLWSNSNTNVNQQWILADVNSDSSGGSTGGGSDNGGTGEFGLNPNADPWDNFDLTDWALDTPAPRDGSSNSSERTTDVQFAAITAGTEDIRDRQKPFFFTADDGGMTFLSTIGGGTTSSGSNGFTRSELREMLRRGNDDIEDTGTTRNNWQLGYAETNSDFGGQPKGGELTATLRVNRVTTTGSTSGQPGRVIVGQIHAGSNEPVRLYYRKLPQNSNGSIYFAHETADNDETYFEIIGSRSSSQSNPSNGIALNELWSYEINQSGAEIEVVIRRGDRNGSIIARETINMNDLDSGYDDRDEWMYFKAGAYTQNDSGDDDDYDEVTFYRLSNTH